MRGLLVTLKGVEGSGKSTHCHLLADWLRTQGREVVLTSEHDRTTLGPAIRGLFVRCEGWREGLEKKSAGSGGS